MIPKLIHYCWLSDDLIPESLQKCMSSWEKQLPGYEFVLWNFKRFPRGTSQWVDEAFDRKKYAFAADYIRLYALYNYGGIYLDMDVEVLKDFSPFLDLKTMMCWQNHHPGLEVAAFGVEKYSQWVKSCLDYYDGKSFVNENGLFNMEPLPDVIEKHLKECHFELCDVETIDEAKNTEKNNTIPVFAYDYFSPKSYKSGEISVSSNTYCIHHFAGSWLVETPLQSLEKKIWNLVGVKNLNLYGKIQYKVFKPISRLFVKKKDS